MARITPLWSVSVLPPRPPFFFLVRVMFFTIHTTTRKSTLGSSVRTCLEAVSISELRGWLFPSHKEAAMTLWPQYFSHILGVRDLLLVCWLHWMMAYRIINDYYGCGCPRWLRRRGCVLWPQGSRLLTAFCVQHVESRPPLKTGHASRAEGALMGMLTSGTVGCRCLLCFIHLPELASPAPGVAQLLVEQLLRCCVIWANIPRLQLQHPEQSCAIAWVTP